MIVLGIDPGYATIGYGVVKHCENRYTSETHGAILTSPKDPFPKRLEIIFDQIYKLIENYSPNAISIEKLYFQNNHKTAIDVAQARGVILLASSKCKVPIYEYTPLQIKSSITGYGQAQKSQIMLMVKKLLKLSQIPKPDDVADALAAGICHINSLGYNNLNSIISKIAKK